MRDERHASRSSVRRRPDSRPIRSDCRAGLDPGLRRGDGCPVDAGRMAGGGGARAATQGAEGYGGTDGSHNDRIEPDRPSPEARVGATIDVTHCSSSRESRCNPDTALALRAQRPDPVSRKRIAGSATSCYRTVDLVLPKRNCSDVQGVAISTPIVGVCVSGLQTRDALRDAAQVVRTAWSAAGGSRRPGSGRAS